MELDRIARLAEGGGGKVLLYVLDGLGGLPREPGGPTELEAARTPNLDELARGGTCGLHDPVAPGITPGSGPGHLALFGYDPLVYETGRGVLEALGIEFPLGPGDIAVRANFCTLDAQGRVTDRRAGRISTDEAAPLAGLLDGIEVDGARCSVRHVKEHRFVLVLHPDARSGDAVDDTDPGQTGRPPHPPAARNAASEPTARLLAGWLEAAAERLANQPRANMALLRGVSSRPDWPLFEDVFGMRAAAAAAYPMYRGVARLVGMDAQTVPAGAPPLVDALRARLAEHDFFFLHFKPPDKAGEDGDFDRKVAAIEEADAGERWKASDHVGNAFIAAIGEGADACPWSGPVSALPIPDDFSERGAPPLITTTGPAPSGGIDVLRGTVRVRFQDPAATVTTELSDPPPPPGNKPVVTVTRQDDGTPGIEIRGGRAIVRVEGWNGVGGAQGTG